MRHKGRSRRVAWLTGGIVLFGAAASPAQDTHYWNSQYGPRAILLGGAVIGSIADMSATYYNPGALGYIKEPELLLSANVFQNSTLTVRDGAGVGIDLTSADFQLLPNMLAGAFRPSWLGKNKFAYSFLTRHRFEVDVSGSRIAPEDVLPDPGVEQFAGGVRNEENVSELWAGVTWARGLGPKVGVGVTQYLSIRSQSSNYRLLAQAMTDMGRTALLLQVDNYSLSAYSLLWKAGLGLKLDPVTIGLTVTTPNLRLFGSGDATLNDTWIGVDRDGDTIPDEGFAADVQNEIRADYKTPVSVGVGAALHLENSRIHAAAEWFSAVDSYAVLDLESFVTPVGQTVTRSLHHRLEDVLNYGFAVEHDFTASLTGLASFVADRSAFHADSDIAVTPYDIYHATGGTTFSLGRPRFTVGLAYAWGNEQIDQIIDLDPSDATVVRPEDKVELLYDRITFILGFALKL